jgi:hypothetical protein
MQSFLEGVADVYENYSWITVDGVKKRNRQKAIPQAEAWAEAYGFIGGVNE